MPAVRARYPRLVELLPTVVTEAARDPDAPATITQLAINVGVL
ncbi:hypothetical protein ACQPWR_28420 [Micromonospora vinacea]